MGKIDLDKAPAWIRNLEGELRKASERGLLSAAHRLVGVMQNELIPAEPRMPVDRGIFKAGWRVHRLGARAVDISNSTPHAVFVEEGVRGANVKPGRAMIDALAQWAIRKGLTGPAKGAERAAAGRQIAWAIAKSMQKKGIFNLGKGLHLLDKLKKRAPAVLEEEIRAEIHKMKVEG